MKLIVIHIRTWFHCLSRNFMRDDRERHRWKEKPNQIPTLLLTKQCWSPRYKVSVLSTCGGCHPKGFIVASFYNFKHIANNYYNNKVIIIIIIIIILNLVEAWTFIYLTFTFKCQFFCVNFPFLLKIFFWTAAWSTLGHYLSTRPQN